MKDQKDQISNSEIDRRDFFAGVAGLTAAAFGVNNAFAGAHQMPKIELTEEEKTAKPVGEGAVILVTGANRS